MLVIIRRIELLFAVPDEPMVQARVETKPYGRTFLESLPACNRTEELDRVSLFVTGRG